MRAARELFAERGYVAVGTNQVVERAGVTRGAMYHRFREKKDIFRAVYEQQEHEVMAAIGASMAAMQDPWGKLVQGIRSFLDGCTDPGLVQIGFVDAPAVLGWQEWRAIHARYSLGSSPSSCRTRWMPGSCAAPM